jgi:hypothetical protein
MKSLCMQQGGVPAAVGIEDKRRPPRSGDDDLRDIGPLAEGLAETPLASDAGRRQPRVRETASQRSL